MKKKMLLLIFICLSYFNCQAQDKIALDSLKSELQKATIDTLRINLKYQIASIYADIDPDSSLKLSNELMNEINGLLTGKYKTQHGASKTTLINYRDKTHIGISYNYFYLGNYEKSLEEINLVIDKTKVSGNKYILNEAYGQAALLYQRLGNPDKAAEYYKISLAISNEIKDTVNLVYTYEGLGILYNAKAQLDSAQLFYEKGLTLAEQLNDKYAVVALLHPIGTINRDRGNYRMALEQYYRALSISEKEIKSQSLIARSLIYIGIIYFYLDDVEKAVELNLKALKIVEKLNDLETIANIEAKLGRFYLKQNKYDKAKTSLFRGLSLYHEMKNYEHEARTYIELGEYYSKVNMHDSALYAQLKALAIADSIKNNFVSALAGAAAGGTYLKLDSLDNAQKFTHLSWSMAKKMDIKAILEKTENNFSQIYLKKGDYKRAFEHYEQYISYRDSLINEENTKKLMQKQMQYEFDKKEAVSKAEHEKKEALTTMEIKRQTLIRNSTFGGVGIAGIFSFLLVRSFNRRRKTSFENKVSKVEMKALLSQMNPHFIFNSLNSIDDYILNNDIKNSSLYVNKFSRLMRLILESSRKEEVTVKEDMEALELYIQLENLRMPHKVEYVIDVAPEINTGQMLIPPMLLQPFIENSFKHAFDGVENPRLEIKISLRDELLHCSVTDNGKGRDPQKLTTETKEIQSSLGTTITRERLDIFSKIKKSKAYFAFEDLMDSHQKAAGTKVVLSVPASFSY